MQRIQYIYITKIFKCFQDNEKVVDGPTKMVIIPPNHYCVVANPVMRDEEGEVTFDQYGQVCV